MVLDPFPPGEIEAIRRAMAAKERQRERGAAPGVHSGKVSPSEERVRDRSGASAGVSGRTVEKIASFRQDGFEFRLLESPHIFVRMKGAQQKTLTAPRVPVRIRFVIEDPLSGLTRTEKSGRACGCAAALRVFSHAA